MARAAVEIDYEAELALLRERYTKATPRQRLLIIRQRLSDPHFGPNKLVTAVSAVEAMARSLVMHTQASTKAELEAVYPKHRYRKPEELVAEYLVHKGVSDAAAFFGEDTWRLFGYAVQYRNALAHECTYLGLNKFPSLIEACEEVLNSLVKLARVREPRA